MKSKEQIWKEEALNRLSSDFYRQYDSSDVENAFTAGCEFEHTRDKWIKVEEGLPEHTGCMYNVVVSGRHTTYVDSMIYKADGWYIDGRHHVNSEITHWQPLPEAPKS